MVRNGLFCSTTMGLSSCISSFLGTRQRFKGEMGKLGVPLCFSHCFVAGGTEYSVPTCLRLEDIVEPRQRNLPKASYNAAHSSYSLN